MKQTVSINRNKHEIQLIAINMKRQFQLIAINRNRQFQLIAINMKRHRNKHETDSFN